MGHPDQFAKQTFAEEVPIITHGAVAWHGPMESSLSFVLTDGTLDVSDAGPLASLDAPWTTVQTGDHIVLEIKMPGDHLDIEAIQRALLRRQANQVGLTIKVDPPWEGEATLWMLAPHVPDVLRRVRSLERIAPGCYRVGPSAFPHLWIAANELPLREALIPFLVARSGRAQREFIEWVAKRRPVSWTVRVIEYVPMSDATREEMLRLFPPTDDPERLNRRRLVARSFLRVDPEFRGETQAEGLSHLFERRLGRPLTDSEIETLGAHGARLGVARVTDVALDLSPAELAAWLADPFAK